MTGPTSDQNVKITMPGTTNNARVNDDAEHCHNATDDRGEGRTGRPRDVTVHHENDGDGVDRRDRAEHDEGRGRNAPELLPVGAQRKTDDAR